MTKTKPKKPAPRRGKTDDPVGFFAEEFAPDYFRAVPPYVVEAERQMQGWNPKKPNTLFQRNRELLNGGNPWVGAWHTIRESFFNDTFGFVGESSKLEKWLDDKGVREMITDLNDDLWNEFLLQDNAVVFWLDPKHGELPNPVVLNCESCQYEASIGGGERLRVVLQKRKLSPKEKKGLSARWVDAYESGKAIDIDPDEGENFKVLKRSKKGTGFGIPKLYSGFRLLSTLENLHVADSCGAYQHRDVIRKISGGRDMKFADAMKQPGYFTLTAKERDKIEKDTKTKRGAFNVIVDAKININWEFMDPKFFASEKYQGTMEQLNLVGGPTMMLLATGHAWLVPFFAAEGRADRKKVGKFLNKLLASSDFLPMKAPKPLKVKWSGQSFRDAATVISAIQMAVSQGAMSTTTAREELGLDDDQEGDRLVQEKKQPERYQPSFEPKQGMLTEKGGRPPKDKPGDGGA